MAKNKAADKLHELLERIFKFPHNASMDEVFKEIYGDEVYSNVAYIQEKRDLILRKGFTYWYCDLDLTNQRKLVGLILKRYPELEDMLS